MKRNLSLTLLLAAAVVLASCGGGGGGDAAPAPAAVDPTISALSGQLPDAAAASTELPTHQLPPDAAAALGADLLPPT